MKEEISLVEEFHKSFEIFSQDTPNINISEQNKRDRIYVMQNEFEEMLQAMNEDDIVHLAKEIGDVLYGLYGTIIAYGLQDKFPQIFKAVHESNMSKLDENGKPLKREDGKILKSDKFFKAEPLIEKILEN